MHHHNKFNMRVILLGARCLWTEQTVLGKYKASGTCKDRCKGDENITLTPNNNPPTTTTTYPTTTLNNKPPELLQYLHSDSISLDFTSYDKYGSLRGQLRPF